MSTFLLDSEEEKPRLRVSVVLRLVVGMSYAIVAVGSAISSILMIRMFQILKSSGLTKTLETIGETSLPALLSLYIAAIIGIVFLLLLIRSKDKQSVFAPPPIWFHVVGIFLCSIPAILFWKAQLTILEVLKPDSSIPKSEIKTIGGNVSELMILSGVAAVVVCSILLLISVLPFSTRSRVDVSSITVVSTIEIIIILAAIVLTASVP